MSDDLDIPNTETEELSTNLHFHRCEACFRAIGCTRKNCLETYTGQYCGGLRVIEERCKKCVKNATEGVVKGTMDDALEASLVNHGADPTVADHSLRLD
jgi:hypothetical protein